jgi:uncharacterized protein (DUF2062 family)
MSTPGPLEPSLPETRAEEAPERAGSWPPRAYRLARERAVSLFSTLLRQGVTPSRLALSIAVGAVLGVFPIFGTTTVLCILVASALRLNHPAVQLVNYAMGPFQLPLLVVFIQLGQQMAGAPPMPLSPGALAEALRADPAGLILELGAVIGRAALAWAVVAPFLGGALYLVALALLRKSSVARRGDHGAAPAAG